jgi:acetyl-CoA acyltransferase 2
MTATDLATHASQAAISHANLSPSKIDESFFGNVTQTSLDATYLSRHVALRVGAPVCTPALTINRLCGSGFEAACLGAEAIDMQRANVTLVGGTENMSQAPMVIDGVSARWGAALGKGLHAEDSLWASLTDRLANVQMGNTAENLATQYNITREESDEYSLRSQQCYGAALAAGIFANEIAPIEVKSRKGTESLATDEHPRPNTTLADLKKLRPVFKEENGTVTAGSASGICDGAASLVVASENACRQHSLRPLARMVAWSRVGCDPSTMGIGPVTAIQNVLAVAGLTLDQMDIIEINEAFAVQFLACEKALGLDRSKVNVNGGAIALGHPLGASGARILTHLTHELLRTGKKYAVGAACIGGGQGIAVVLENAADFAL